MWDEVGVWEAALADSCECTVTGNTFTVCSSCYVFPS